MTYTIKLTIMIHWGLMLEERIGQKSKAIRRLYLWGVVVKLSTSARKSKLRRTTPAQSSEVMSDTAEWRCVCA
jgi:hypothetical protein